VYLQPAEIAAVDKDLLGVFDSYEMIDHFIEIGKHIWLFESVLGNQTEKNTGKGVFNTIFCEMSIVARCRPYIALGLIGYLNSLRSNPSGTLSQFN
jgi:hypothetical protein